jgi:glycosyltransferase involved in cell wall biosynthesis
MVTEPSRPLLSLIVCTRNRQRYLAGFFGAVAAMRCAHPWEFIIVDNGSTDGTTQALPSFAAGLDVPTTIVSEPRPGLGRARNAGVAAARGEIFVFTDDDCYPATDFLDRLAEVFRDPAVGFAGGRILLHDPHDSAVSIRTEQAPTVIPAHSVVPAGLIQGANMAFRRSVLERIGGFDDALGAGTPFCSEDVDAVARASAAGFTGGYFPGPTVAHHHRRRDPAEVAELWRRYDRGRGAYYAKCILDFPERGRYARFWWQTRGGDSWSATLSEVAGAIDYCVRRATGRLA